MKLVKTASGKETIKISKSEWESIGRTAGWLKTAEETEDAGEFLGVLPRPNQSDMEDFRKEYPKTQEVNMEGKISETNARGNLRTILYMLMDMPEREAFAIIKELYNERYLADKLMSLYDNEDLDFVGLSRLQIFLYGELQKYKNYADHAIEDRARKFENVMAKHGKWKNKLEI